MHVSVNFLSCTVYANGRKGENSEGLKEPSKKDGSSVQKQLKESIAVHTAFSHSITRWKTNNIAKDMLPLGTVSGEGFLRMIK